MTIHYHGTPITSPGVLDSLAGKFFCVSFAYPEQVKRVHEIGQGVMLDNGAFTTWKQGRALDINEFWDWASPWLDCPTTWAVLPDSIEGDYRETMGLIGRTPLEFKVNPHKVTPVWHLHDPLERLIEMADEWPRICFGSSAEYAEVGTPQWHKRISDAFELLYKKDHKHTQIHMLRGMKCSKMPYPFYSVDSTDVARNHHAAKNGKHFAKLMADNWDHHQCPIRFEAQPQHEEIF